MCVMGRVCSGEGVNSVCNGEGVQWGGYQVC